MQQVFQSDIGALWQGDCIEVMRSLPEMSVDAVVTDPPYGISFYGEAWDTPVGFGEFCRGWLTEALRVTKPGGYCVAFGGSRMWHHMAVAAEQAGWEIQDQIAWIYTSGFPKSLDVDLLIDTHFGEIRPDRTIVASGVEKKFKAEFSGNKVENRGTPVTAEATEWVGWGTGLKPAFEPILVLRRPLVGTIAENTLAYGTGGINIQETRWEDGRWPGNVLTDGEGPAGELEELGFPAFRVQSKAGRDERPIVGGVEHPTVKPVGLMQWLVRLVARRGAVVLEPFAGSGTTLEACVAEGRKFIGIEREEEFIPLIEARMGQGVEATLFDTLR